MTKRFFNALEADRVKMLTDAAEHAVNYGTGPNNAREHNNLVKAAAYKKIKTIYANRNTIPDSYQQQGIASAAE